MRELQLDVGGNGSVYYSKEDCVGKKNVKIGCSMDAKWNYFVYEPGHPKSFGEGVVDTEQSNGVMVSFNEEELKEQLHVFVANLDDKNLLKFIVDLE